MNGTIFTLRNLYRDGTICLEKAGIADAKLDAWYLLEYETKISRAMFLADPDKEVEKDKAEHYWKDIETRAQRIPLQHITGEQEFMGLCFQFKEPVFNGNGIRELNGSLCRGNHILRTDCCGITIDFHPVHLCEV